jgi:hypothetical protein
MKRIAFGLDMEPEPELVGAGTVTFQKLELEPEP